MDVADVYQQRGEWFLLDSGGHIFNVVSNCTREHAEEIAAGMTVNLTVVDRVPLSELRRYERERG